MEDTENNESFRTEDQVPSVYYTIVNEGGQQISMDTEESCDTGDNKIIYLSIKQDSESDNNLLIPDNSPINTVQCNVTDNNSLQTLGMNNLKLITLEDGRMFLTNTAEDENFESIQPYLISSQDEYHEPDIKNEDNNEESNGRLLHLIGNQDDSHETQTKGIENGVEDIRESLTEECVAEPEYNIIQIVDESHNVYSMVVYNQNESADEVVKVAEETQKPKFRCLYDGCEKAYSSSSQLTTHMRNHVNSKPYNCTSCDKEFSTNYSLKSHLRTHTGEKPYGCNLCHKCFRTSGDLQKHIRTHTGEKPFSCPVENCGKSFTTTNIRKVHIRSHTGERPYVCDYPNCGKAFSSSTNYKNHTRIHSGEKPYLCTIVGCDRRFTEYSSLYKHTMVHQVERPFECAFCTQRFKTVSSMNLHKRVRHNVIVSPDGIDILVNLQCE